MMMIECYFCGKPLPALGRFLAEQSSGYQCHACWNMMRTRRDKHGATHFRKYSTRVARPRPAPRRKAA